MNWKKLAWWIYAAQLLTAAFATVVKNFAFQSSSSSRIDDEIAYYELSTNVVPGEFCDPNSLSLSGYFGVDGSKYDNVHKRGGIGSIGKHYFFWMFERRPNNNNSVRLLSNAQKSENTAKSQKSDNSHKSDKSSKADQGRSRTSIDDKIPFVVWLNGGPGCSSLLGLLTENGPCLVNSNGNSTTPNPYSWNEVAHVLYLDQPAKVGYSYGNANDDNDDMVAGDAYYFLQSFFQSKEGAKYRDSPLYLTGESYAGHYIPAIAHRIYEGNKKLGKDLLHLPLSGLAIGNGFYDMELQMKSFPEMAYNNPHNLKIVTKQEYEKMKQAASTCSQAAHTCKHEMNEFLKGLDCQLASSCEEQFFPPLLDRNISIYNIKQPCIGDLCTDDIPITTFLNLDTTKSTLGVPDVVTWETCDDYVNVIWSDIDRVANFAKYLPEVLDEMKLPVLIYAGDLDYICNFIGNKEIALTLEWDHKDEFNKADDHDWNNGGGMARTFDRLTYLQVYDAGHMVPTDQPKQALDMITHFLNGDTF